MRLVSERGEPIDVITLSAELKNAGLWEKVGGQGYLGDIGMKVPSSANALHYATIVRDKAAERRLLQIAAQMDQICREAGPSARDKISQTKALLLNDGTLNRVDNPKAPSKTGTEILKELAADFDAEAREDRQTIGLPWRQLSRLSRALRPGTVMVLAGLPGYGKTLFSTELAVYIHSQGHRFAYLPLEGNRKEFVRRILAHISGDWSALDGAADNVDVRINSLFKYEPELAAICEQIDENPRLPKQREDGRLIVPPLPYEEVLDWTWEKTKTARVIIVDPIAQIDFRGRNEWQSQKKFIQEATAIAGDSSSTVIIVCHTVKHPNSQWKTELSLSDVQGAKEIAGLTDCVLLLNRHSTKESGILCPGGETERIEHDRTLTIGKSRFGPGDGLRIAFRLNGPRFQELGVIAPRQKTSTVRPSPSSIGPEKLPYKD